LGWIRWNQNRKRIENRIFLVHEKHKILLYCCQGKTHGLGVRTHKPSVSYCGCAFLLVITCTFVCVLFCPEWWILVLLRFQMHPCEFQILKPTWLVFNWVCFIGLTWFILRKESDFKTWRKKDGLEEFWELKELCETNMLWLITLDASWYVWMFLWYLWTWKPTLLRKFRNRWFCENRRTWSKWEFMFL